MLKRTDRKPDIEKVIARLETVCARAEHSSYEVLEKLRRMGIVGEQADKIVADLKAHRFVDDARFARALVNDKVKFARWGRRKVVAALYRKRIDEQTIETALEAIEDEVYRNNLEHIMSRKAATMSDLHSRESRAKLIRFGISNGYEPDMVMDIVRRLASPADE